MQDEEICLFNACTDLVTLKKCEAFPLRLLTSKRAGDWVAARDFCQLLGIAGDDLTAEIFATWLADPTGNNGYVVIVFYDKESQWTMAAQFNRARLVDAALPNQGLQPGAAPLPASSSTSQS